MGSDSETHNKDGIRQYKLEAIPYQNRQQNYLDLHTRNFIKAIKNNDPSILKCGIETGSVAAINAHMGNIAYKTGRKVYWDAAKGQFKNDKEANALITPDYQNGWRLP